MPRFDIHHNPNPVTRDTVPYLMDVQYGLFAELRTRVVIPLVRADQQGRPMERLTPVITIEGEPCILLTPQLAGIACSELGEPVVNGGAHRDQVIQALDFLFTGS